MWRRQDSEGIGVAKRCKTPTGGSRAPCGPVLLLPATACVAQPLIAPECVAAGHRPFARGISVPRSSGAAVGPAQGTTPSRPRRRTSRTGPPQHIAGSSSSERAYEGPDRCASSPPRQLHFSMSTIARTLPPGQHGRAWRHSFRMLIYRSSTSSRRSSGCSSIACCNILNSRCDLCKKSISDKITKILPSNERIFSPR